MARAFSSGALDPRGVTLQGGPKQKVYNSSGEDLPASSVLAIANVLILPSDNLTEFQRRPVIIGDPPDAEVHSGKFVVTTEPIADGKIGECVAMGVAAVLVDDGDGDFADVATGGLNYLARGEVGAKILWVSSSEADEAENRFWALVAVGSGGGGEDCLCEAVHELRIDNSPTGGTIGLTYTIEGTTGSLVTINHNSTASAAATAIRDGNPATLTTDNLKVYGGPLPMVALYIRFTADLSGVVIPLPTVSNALTGTNVIPKYGHFTAPGWGTSL